MVIVGSRAKPRRVELIEESIRERILSVGAGWMTAQYALVQLVAELDAAFDSGLSYSKVRTLT